MFWYGTILMIIGFIIFTPIIADGIIKHKRPKFVCAIVLFLVFCVSWNVGMHHIGIASIGNATAIITKDESYSDKIHGREYVVLR